MKRTYLHFYGKIKDISGDDLTQTNRFIGVRGNVTLLYSRSSRYQKVFAIFQSEGAEHDGFQTTPGVIDKEGERLILTTDHHRYAFEIIRFYNY